MLTKNSKKKNKFLILLHKHNKYIIKHLTWVEPNPILNKSIKWSSSQLEHNWKIHCNSFTSDQRSIYLFFMILIFSFEFLHFCYLFRKMISNAMLVTFYTMFDVLISSWASINDYKCIWYRRKKKSQFFIRKRWCARIYFKNQTILYF